MPEPARTREKEPIPGSLGAVIRDERKSRGWSQEMLAEMAGIGQNDVSRVETGKSRNPQEQTLLAIAEALSIPLGILYERTFYPELSYQIPELREELRGHGLASQTVMLHLARHIRHSQAPLTDLDPEKIARFFEEAVASLDGNHAKRSTPA